MDDTSRQMLYAGAAGLVLGVAGYSLIAPGEESLPVYTGLNREYGDGKKQLQAMIYAQMNDAMLEEYEIDIFGNYEDGEEMNFPDFKSPKFETSFNAAVYADEIAHDLGFHPLTPWAGDANKASEVRAKERKKK